MNAAVSERYSWGHRGNSAAKSQVTLLPQGLLLARGRSRNNSCPQEGGRIVNKGEGNQKSRKGDPESRPANCRRALTRQTGSSVRRWPLEASGSRGMQCVRTCGRRGSSSQFHEWEQLMVAVTSSMRSWEAHAQDDAHDHGEERGNKYASSRGGETMLSTSRAR